MTTTTISATYAGALELKSPVTALSVTAAGYIEGNSQYGVYAAATATAAYAVYDAGVIKGGRYGVLLTHGGVVETAVGCEIAGYIAVKVSGAAGTVVNDGLMQGSGATTNPAILYLTAGGTITNGAAGDTGAAIVGFRAVKVTNAAGEVFNYGTIDGLVRSSIILFDGGAVTNGALSDTTALIKGGTAGVASAGAPLTVTNFATISGLLQILAGGVLVNGAAGDTAASVVNANSGMGAVAFYRDPGTVTNYGLIRSTAPSDGVYLDAGTLTNGGASDGGALIEGSVGVQVTGLATVRNFGVIEGDDGVSVAFGAGGDRLIAEAGSSLIGTADGGGGALELAGGAGTITGLGATGEITGAVSATFSGFGTYAIDAGGVWTLAAGDAVTSGKTLSSRGSLIAAGNLVNGGQIVLASAGANTDLRIGPAGATLSGGGTVSMSGTKARVLGATAAAILDNVDNTISGTGFLGANQLAFTNAAAGVVDAVGAAGLTVGTKGETLVNAGLMEATGGGILAITNTTVINTGTLLATNLSPVKLQNVVVRGGSIAATGSGVIKFNVSGGELNGTANAVSLSGVAFIVNGSNETLVGSIADAGKINLIASTSTSDLIIGAAGATLSGGGQVNMTNSLSNRIYGLASGDTLTNVDNRIDGAGVLGNGVMTLVNAAKGQIVGNQNFSFTIDTGANTILNAGLIENVGKGGTLVKSAVNNTGTLLAATAGTLTLAGSVTGAGVAIINGGTLYVRKAYAENVTFSGATGVLELGDSQAFNGTVTGLSKTGTSWLDLTDISGATAKAAYSGTTASGTLTVTDGAHTARITLVGNYLGSTWTVSGDGHGGTKVVDPSGVAAPLAQAMAAFPFRPASRPIETLAAHTSRLPILHVPA